MTHRILKDTNMQAEEPNKKLNQYVVHFNNHGEILRHYTSASTHKQAMMHAAHQISRLLGVNPGAIASRMKRPNSVSVIGLSKGE